ncbi:conserved exported hypothetical protein [uncultured Stenotrophomonas sp.]|uniref:Sulfatase-modifying factor enzyme-like domain-containing protein n=1 Tax=uncultured Stenotrophomonas sp. TaxID=165438 RepID=A0A1Y5Q641_9GAMM|nr:conserved exported hypothetical protein [uncultured Stenotrophomonas sp.]
MERMRPLLLALALAPALAGASGPEPGYRMLDGGAFHSSVRFEDATGLVPVAPYQLMQHPVSNAQFAAFVTEHPQWRRDRIPALFASPGYLGHWETATGPGTKAAADAPVAHVNWYAADAYCRAQGARLPTFLEWEFAAAADATRFDARDDRAWRLRQINDGTPRAIDAATGAPANAWGIHGLHGANWEWSGDFTSLLGDGDRRGQEDGEALRFCGATALAFNDPGDYGVVKRFVLLSALQPSSTLGNLGFRCARSQP